LPALNVCIQVNIDREPQKAGVLPEQLEEVVRYSQGLQHLRPRGLMAIPKPVTEEHDSFDSYRRMRRLFDELNAAGHSLDTLSMGMSGDLEAAIIEGSTLVRIGTDLLGARD
jgi:pyridoxal phosphate enzyme (YggS family)